MAARCIGAAPLAAPLAAPEAAEILAAQARVGAVLAKDPWPRDEDRAPKRVAEDLLGRRREAADQAKAAAEAARRQVRDRRRAAGLFGRLRPSTRRELQALAADAERAEQQADRARVTDGDRSPAEAQAKGVTTARIAERRRWHDSRDVQDARKADEELRLVREAVERRDPEITAAAAQGDLKRARELAVEQAEERRRQELEQALTGYEPGRSPSPGRGPGPAPSPRR